MFKFISKRRLIDLLAKKMWPGCSYEYEERINENGIYEIKIKPTRNDKYLNSRSTLSV